jgi:large subunit ribosomal protein L25
MKTVALTGELRSELGSKSSRALRNEGKVPCVLYGGGELITSSFIHLTLKPSFTPQTLTKYN